MSEDVSGPRVLCSRQGKLIGGCRFEPQFDYGPALPADQLPFHYWVDAVMAASRPETYVGHVCIQCGEFVRRP